MTALAGRRRRSTLIAAGAAAVALVVAMALTALGAVTLYNSTEGADAAPTVPELRFPSTPTAALAAVDGDGGLASVAVLVADPSGRGGNVVTIPVSADASAGRGDERLPIDETLDLVGPDALQGELESVLGIALDATEIVDAARLAELLAPVGPVTVDVPVDVTDADGDVVVGEGETTLEPADAAAVLTARDPGVPAVDRHLASAAVWQAVAVAAGEAARGAVDPAATGAPSAEAILGAVLAGPAGHRAIGRSAAEASSNARGVDVAQLDQAELVLVFAQIAPGRVAAPNPALTLRVESPFTDEQLEAVGLTSTQVAHEAIGSLLFVGGNVLSVSTEPGDVGEETVVEIADETLTGATEGVELLFGPMDVHVAETRIVGVDALVRLGTGYLDLLAEERDEEGSEGD